MFHSLWEIEDHNFLFWFREFLNWLATCFPQLKISYHVLEKF